jgi:hypothetical protein
MSTITKVLIILAIILAVSFMYIIITKTNKLTNADTEMKSYVGKKIVINNDTLMITNYSLFRECFILQNNTEVNKNIVKTLTIIE